MSAVPPALATLNLLDAMEGVAWLTDLEGTIIAVGQRGWATFAADNGAPNLTSQAVIGGSLFASIQGSAVQAAYRRLHAAVSTGRRAQVVFEYRCDSPIAERHMRMAISGVSDGRQIAAVLYQSQLIEQKLRPPLPLFSRQLRRATEHPPVVLLCAFCQQVEWPVGEARGRRRWISTVDYYRMGGPDAAAVESVICPRCEREVLAANA